MGDRAAQVGEKIAGVAGGGGGDRAVTKNVETSMCLISEDSSSPEFGRQYQPRGNFTAQSSYAPVH